MTTTTTATTAGKGRRRRPRILLGVTGSVAAVKAPEIAVRLCRECDADVKILLTRGGENFWTKAESYDPINWNELMKHLQKAVAATSISLSSSAAASAANENVDNGGDENVGIPRMDLIRADDEWKGWERIGDSVLHIDLRNWADILLVAPLSAHTLAKFSGGLCDDTLSCVVRAWDFGGGQQQQQRQQTTYNNNTNSGKPMLLAPAMNTFMWEHPLTRSQLDTVKSFAVRAGEREESQQSNSDEDSMIDVVRIIAPQVKTLACGEVGDGALASVDSILTVVKDVCKTIQ